LRQPDRAIWIDQGPLGGVKVEVLGGRGEEEMNETEGRLKRTATLASSFSLFFVGCGGVTHADSTPPRIVAMIEAQGRI